MDNERFNERLKIAYFRAVTNRLRERGLITREEFDKIVKSIEQSEADLIAAKPLESGIPGNSLQSNDSHLAP